MISIRGPIRIGLDEFELSAQDCPNRKTDSIWLEYGRGPKKQPTVWCCGDMVPRDPLALLQNQEFWRFHHSLTSKKKTKECSDNYCFTNDVTATLTGRFESVLTVVCPDGKILCPAGEGFGHQGSFSTRVVIHQVADIEVKLKPSH